MTGLERIALDGQHGVWLGILPAGLRLDATGFAALWEMHPGGFHQVKMFGKSMTVPRWSETYGRDYPFSGTVQRAKPVPALLAPLLAWSTATVEARANGLLVNWYDGALGHKIGAHRDDEKELIAGAPIITISFGESRTFRLRRWKGKDRYDIVVRDGSVLVLPYATNMVFTHEVPASKQHVGRRISVTIRAFGDAA
jgi:alkylated DNA repair dioxygenase AlkB